MRGCAGVDGRAYSALETRRNGPAGRRANDDEYCAHVARLPFLATRVLRQCARARACVCVRVRVRVRACVPVCLCSLVCRFADSLCAASRFAFLCAIVVPHSALSRVGQLW